jgi:hypothetical protein
LVEAAVAVILLAGLAFVGPGGSVGRLPAESSTIPQWTGNALPLVTKLISDCTAIENDSGPASATGATTKRGDAARYELDLAAAQRLPVPPDSELAQAWRATLGQAASATSDLATGPGANEDARARTRLRFVAVSTVLLQFQQAIRPAQ